MTPDRQPRPPWPCDDAIPAVMPGERCWIRCKTIVGDCRDIVRMGKCPKATHSSTPAPDPRDHITMTEEEFDLIAKNTFDNEFTQDLIERIRSRLHTTAPCTNPELCSLLREQKAKAKAEREKVLRGKLEIIDSVIEQFHKSNLDDMQTGFLNGLLHARNRIFGSEQKSLRAQQEEQ